jgi:hypothetical protein
MVDMMDDMPDLEAMRVQVENLRMAMAYRLRAYETAGEVTFSAKKALTAATTNWEAARDKEQEILDNANELERRYLEAKMAYNAMEVRDA